MGRTDVDKLSQDAFGASLHANKTHSLTDHHDAADKHREAAQAAESAGRPSLGQTHRAQQGYHDQVANNANSAEHKAEVAHAACDHAIKVDTHEAHESAASAYRAAATAHDYDGGSKGVAKDLHARADEHAKRAGKLRQAEWDKKNKAAAV